MTTQHRLGAALTVLALLFTFISTALMPTMAQAEVVRFHASRDQVAAACKSAGGIETSGGGGNGYGCVKLGCAGGNSSCHVDCNAKGSCIGSTPRRAPANTLTGFLRGLTKGMGYQVPQSIVDGVDSNAGAAVAPSAPSAPAPTPPIFN